MSLLNILPCIALLVNIGWAASLQQPLQSRPGVQTRPAYCKPLPVGKEWPALKDSFDLQLEGEQTTYSLVRIQFGSHANPVYKVLDKEQSIIAYAKTPRVNTEKEWEGFCNEIDATTDVQQAIANGLQITGTSTDPNPRPWLLVRPMRGTILKENPIFKASGRKCIDLIRLRLLDKYMDTTRHYIKQFGWWHDDANQANAFWDEDLNSVDYIDWGSAKRVPPAKYDEDVWRQLVFGYMERQCPF